jgi:hypothetical protein
MVQITPRPRRAAVHYSMRIDSQIKRDAEQAALLERRSLANLIEHLLAQHCRQQQAPAAAAGEPRR